MKITDDMIYHLTKRYRREAWRRTVIEKLKTRRLNNLRRNVGLSHEMYHKWRFER